MREIDVAPRDRPINAPYQGRDAQHHIDQKETGAFHGTPCTEPARAVRKRGQNANNRINGVSGRPPTCRELGVTAPQKFRRVLRYFDRPA